jgi:hypothetical protein
MFGMEAWYGILRKKAASLNNNTYVCIFSMALAPPPIKVHSIANVYFFEVHRHTD